MADPWMEFSEYHSGPAASSAEGSGWAWPVDEAKLREALLGRGLHVALVRLFPGRPEWWNGDIPVPLALVDGILPDLQARLGGVPGYVDHLPAELRVWSVPVEALDRASRAFEREGLSRLLDWLQDRVTGDTPTSFEGRATLHLDGTQARLAEG